jgi:protein-L-isoaspartate(D-aspartate) O-methyltransferase
VISAMLAIPRHIFVPDELRRYAYIDGPLPIGSGQTISQPYIVAFTLETLGLKGTEKVLEIGTGSGYQTALLARLAKEVWSLERISLLRELAAKRMDRLGLSGNVHMLLKDGYLGIPAIAPFDAIVLSAAPEEIPKPLLEQLSDCGGVFVGPVGPQGCQKLVRITRMFGNFSIDELMDVAFVPLVPGLGEETERSSG